ncbi:M14 family zinc carboxypeptidase [Flectobacillus rivi]|uniref:M14 family zinc carboxypeptidase n=1 Tax=Flectobacillus rivi TaxID=2984209 RepID=A0ABT6Z0D7_9BACT|nr:M14 family zinc carboxypeptidase [Flectobacillus rivi]MDI9874514.1 M14 family zinc carboxypeptidase [Flectobacillus rivi]
MTQLTQINAQELQKNLFDSYEQFQEKAITKRRFGHATLVNLLEKLKSNPLFDVQIAEKSTEGRAIYQVKVGNGPIKVLLWSQMHGNEATATMALMDIFNFLGKDTPAYSDFKKTLLERCTFYVVPMLNPDGAEAWSRYTALGIDMNRDALALQTPEGRLLKKLVKTLKPDFGFNLHDKDRRYSAGQTGNLATMSFLATAYNEAQEVNDVRKKAMQVIVQMNRGLQQYLPNCVGKWPSDFEPRAFGDNIQKWGTSLILIESGGFKNDPEKQYIRKLNYISILSALNAVATKSYVNETTETYDALPVNEKAIFDLIIRNVTIQKGKVSYVADIAINRGEEPVSGDDDFVNTSTVEEIGDMSVFFGTDEIDGKGLTIQAKKEISLGMKADFTLLKNDEVKYVIKNGVIQ